MKLQFVLVKKEVFFIFLRSVVYKTRKMCHIKGLKLPNLPLTPEGDGEVIISSPC